MKTIYIEKTDIAATLTTWIYCAFWMKYTADKNGLESYINWPDSPGRCLQAYKDKVMFRKCPNMYEWYFEQPSLIIPSDKKTVWTWEFPKWGATDINHEYSLMFEPLSVIKDYYKKNLKFNKTTDMRGQTLVDKYQIDFSKTIGITWRGTDVYLDGRPRMPIEKYFPFIDDILHNNPDFRIMCTAEETKILDPLLERYPTAFIIEEFIMAPHGSKHNPERFSSVSGYERGLQPALIVWLFSKCAHYIKNRSSSGGVASWLSNGRIVSLGHPENLGFPANTNTVEIEGKLYPL
jgi:hypothetical protein